MAHPKVINNGLTLNFTPADGSGDQILTISSTGVVKAIPAITTPLSASLTNGNIFVGNGSNIATGVTPSGDITLTNTGVFGIATGVILNADVNASAAIAYSKLNLTGGIVNADVNASAAIAYSKLNLVGAIVNADVNASAAIARTKFANGTANRVVVNSAGGVMTDNAEITANRALISDANGLPIHATTTATEIEFVNGVTSAIQTQLNTKIVSKSTSSTLQAPGVGQQGFVISWDNTNSRFDLTSVSASGVPNGGTTNQILRKIDNTDQNTEWHTLVFGDLTDVSGTTVTEINLLNGMTVSSTELNTLTGIGGNVQTQLDNKLSSLLATNNLYVGVAGVATATTNLPSGTTIGSAVIYRVGGTDVSPADGGTGISSYTVGDILYASGTTTLSKLSLGSALQVLRVNAGATGLEYATPAGGISGLTTNRIPYATSATTLGDDSNLTWDATNDVLTVAGARLHTTSTNTPQFNLFLGTNSGNFTNTGLYNVSVGHSSLTSLTSGIGNTGIGGNSAGGVLTALTTGARNTALGNATLIAITTTSDNTAVGASSLSANTSSQNTAVGSSTISTATSCANNVAVGYQALNGLTSGGDSNTALGHQAGDNITTGDRNVIIGATVDAQSTTADGQLSIQNIIFGVGNTGTGTTASTGSIGVGEPSPTRKFEVAGSVAIKAGSSSGQLARVGGVLNTNTTQTGNITTGEDTIFTYTVPANVLATDKDTIVLTVTGTYANTANNKQVRIKFGGTTIVDVTDTSSSSGNWSARVEIIRTGTSTQKCSGIFISSTGSNDTSFYTTAGETLSGTVVLLVTGEATATNDIVFEMGKVRWEPAE